MLRGFNRCYTPAVRMKRPSALTVVALVLLVLVPTLAFVQYRWVGQVSEADRERMQTHVRNAAMQFREALDGEIARAVLNLQVGTLTARDGSSDRYTDRYDAWVTTATHPQLVANVYLLDADEASQLQLRRWNAGTDVFEATEWPDVLRPFRTQFEHDLVNFREAGNLRRVPFGGDIDESIVLAPVRPPGGGRRGGGPQPPPTFGFTVVQLDINYVRSQMLPELAQRYFQTLDNDGYRVSVVSATNAGAVIYRSDPDAPSEVARADATEPLFGMRGDVFFFSRFGNGRGDGRRTVAINIFRGDGGRGDGANGGAARQFDRDFGRWMLLAQHRTGSLETAVTRARRRNLGIGFGILLMLSISVAMLTLSSRRAQSLARQQMEFVAGVSHELRTPIAVIRSAAENLAEGVVGSPDRVKRYGDAIGTEARRLGEMVEHVMQYAGLESGRGLAAHVPLAPATLVDEALAEAQPAITAAGVHVERTASRELPAVLGDPVALRSAVQNLIANAVKYGGEDRWVGIRIVRSDNNREVTIAVEDHGAGIPAAELPHIFEPFYRGAEAIGRQIHGNGLGLSIVKRIVSAHGGRIGVSTKPGEGSAFRITLPALLT